MSFTVPSSLMYVLFLQIKICLQLKKNQKNIATFWKISVALSKEGKFAKGKCISYEWKKSTLSRLAKGSCYNVANKQC